MTAISIRKMKKNQSGTIEKVRGGTEISRRIREMGLVPGTVITVLRRAPLNDPVHLKFNQNSITLRNNEADYIFIKADSPTDTKEI